MDYFNENISPMLISLRALQLLLFDCCYKSSNNIEFNKLVYDDSPKRSGTFLLFDSIN